MELTGISLNQDKGRTRYTAVWKVDRSRAIHDKLPAFISNEPEAWSYALDNRPTWGTVSAPGGGR